jgi:hypothetical protein
MGVIRDEVSDCAALVDLHMFSNVSVKSNVPLSEHLGHAAWSRHLGHKDLKDVQLMRKFGEFWKKEKTAC